MILPRPLHNRIFKNIILIFLLLQSQGLWSQQLLGFIENCKDCIGQVKQVKIKQKANHNEYNSPTISRVESYDKNNVLSKTELYLNQQITKTIHYKLYRFFINLRTACHS